MQNVKAFLLVAVASATVAAPAVADQPSPPVPPPTLTDELLIDNPGTITATCNPTGVSTLTFSAAGIAYGPYPGTFTESGTATIGPQTFTRGIFPAGLVQTFSTSFEIDSPVGLVTGTKQLVLPASEFGAICGTVPTLTAYGVSETLSYEARIRTADAVYRDVGTAETQLNRTIFPSGEIRTSQFDEYFASSLLVPELVCVIKEHPNDPGKSKCKKEEKKDKT